MTSDHSTDQQLSAAIATFFNPDARAFLNKQPQWSANYRSVLARIAEARTSGDISDDLLKDLW